MKIDIQCFNLQQQLEEAEKRRQPGEPMPVPAIYLVREKPDERFQFVRGGDVEWRIVDFPLIKDVGQQLSANTGGEHVRVPLFPYLTDGPAPETLIQFALGQGMKALHLAPRDKPVAQMFIAIGNVFTRSDGKPGYQYHIGFAFEMQ